MQLLYRAEINLTSNEYEEIDNQIIDKDERGNRCQILGQKRKLDDKHCSQAVSDDFVECSHSQVLQTTSLCNAIVLREGI